MLLGTKPANEMKTIFFLPAGTKTQLTFQTRDDVVKIRSVAIEWS